MLLIKPYLGCNLRCKYCYEGVYRKKHKPGKEYNLEAVLKRMEEFKDLEISLHGGEILCLPKKDVETMLAKSYELKGKSSIQTNATLIDDEWIEIFKKYKTNVGISWDGPGELSEYRPGSAKVGSIIEKLVKQGVQVSTIIVVSKANVGTKERLKKLKKYLLHLEQLKVHGRVNPCLGVPNCELKIEKLKEIYLDLADFCLKNALKWSPFEDIINGLKGNSRVCTFMGCDPFSTSSATVVLSDGSITNCMRTNKEGILLRHPVQYKTRDEILANVPREYGGCKDCRYWLACHGGCPSGAIDNDWRNRTYLCPVWKALFEFHEKVFSYCRVPLAICQRQGEPIETKPDRGHGDVPHGDSHGDHTDGKLPEGEPCKEHGDAPHGDHTDEKLPEIEPCPEHGDAPHGDVPHGDSHGDHYDAERLREDWKDHKDSNKN